MNRYVLTAAVGPDTYPVDQAVLTDFCQDEDGCEVILWSVLESTGGAKRTRLIVDGASHWQTTDSLKGVDEASGSETVLADVGFCSLKDGFAVDTAEGFVLHNLLGATCTLVLID